VDVYDPWVDAAEAMREYGVEMTEMPEAHGYDAVVLAVAHSIFERDLVDRYGKPKIVVFDVKGLLPKSDRALRL
jgi:UDP-N-acetyl-D-glucosamine/UDP-N-acetyl-D-galactosamine dehydrogenase